MSTESFLEEIKKRFAKVELEKHNSMGQFNHESNSLYYSEVEADDDSLIKDNAEF